MNREEAIKTLENIKKGLYPWYPDEVLDMAIHALKQEPCEDAISRQAVLDIVSGYKEPLESYIGSPDDSEIYAYARGLLLSIERNLNALQPSVGTEETGHWIDKDDKSAVCSCCNRNNTLYGNFCKWCGAKMEVEE